MFHYYLYKFILINHLNSTDVKKTKIQMTKPAVGESCFHKLY